MSKIMKLGIFICCYLILAFVYGQGQSPESGQIPKGRNFKGKILNISIDCCEEARLQQSFEKAMNTCIHKNLISEWKNTVGGMGSGFGGYSNMFSGMNNGAGGNGYMPGLMPIRGTEESGIGSGGPSPWGSSIPMMAPPTTTGAGNGPASLPWTTGTSSGQGPSPWGAWNTATGSGSAVSAFSSGGSSPWEGLTTGTGSGPAVSAFSSGGMNLFSSGSPSLGGLTQGTGSDSALSLLSSLNPDIMQKIEKKMKKMKCFKNEFKNEKLFTPNGGVVPDNCPTFVHEKLAEIKMKCKREAEEEGATTEVN